MVNKGAESFLEERYYQPGEDWEKLCRRVTKAHAKTKKEEREYFEMLFECRALPNSPALMNSGTRIGYLSACNLVPVPDDLEGIMDAIKASALIQKSGGGVGFNFSKLRPTGDRIGGTGGTTSGVLSFLKMFDVTSQMIKQGGKRRSANLGLLRYDHPDILRWLSAKDKEGELTTFNISIGLTDHFFDKAERGVEIVFINPRNGKPFPAYDPLLKTNRSLITARELYKRIAKSMWESAEPGVIFWDAIQNGNTTPELGNLQGVNPCGETSLYYWESCCLGSVNLYNHIHEEGGGRMIDLEGIADTTKRMVRLLNSIIDKNKYPLKEMKKAAKKTRKIGVGIMGLADLFGAFGVRYGSDESIDMINQIMVIIQEAAYEESLKLGEKHGACPVYAETPELDQLRNSTLTSIAPTGSISLISGVSGGIEPFFQMSYKMNREDKDPIVVFARSFLEDLRTHDLEDVLIPMMKHNYTPAQMIDAGLLPEDFSHYQTSAEISPEDHIRVQAAFQSHIDMNISKTINLPERSTVEDVMQIIQQAHETGCKGITVYREGSREGFLTKVECDNCGSDDMERSEGCIKCRNCGISFCSIS